MKKHLLLTALAVLLIGSGAFAQITFFVTNPASLKGQYPFGRSSDTGWGHNLDTVVAQGTLIVGRDSTAADSLACTTGLANAAACAGKIVVLYRGSCEFGVKALRAQQAGAIGVVIVNNVAGAPITLGAGANGVNVTIPTLMISQATGVLLRSAIDDGSVTAIIGNKRGFFANDLGMTGKEVVVAPNYATPLSQVANGGGYRVPVGVSAVNFGTASRTSILINANITFNGAVVYNQDTTAASMATNDSVNFAFPTFNPAPHGLGTYKLKYTVSGNGTEDFPDDNSVTTTFLVTDSTWSKGRIDSVGMPQYTNGYTKDGGGDVEIGATFLANKGSRLRAMGLTGALTIGATDSLNNEAMVARMYEWADANNDAVVDASELTQLAEGFYTYTVNERYAFKRMSLDDIFTSTPGILMSDSATYIFSVFYPGTKTAFVACDEQVDYTTTVPFINQRASVAYTTQWFSDGFGREIMPAIKVDFQAVSTTSVQNEARNDLKIRVYPNPATDHVLIKVDGDQFLGDMNYQVIDITGRTVKSGVRNVNDVHDSFRLDVQDINPGTYSIVMKTKTGFNTTRFVVVH